VAGSAAPTVAITSPANGSTVEGDVVVTATSTASAGDVPTYITIHDGVDTVGTAECEEQQTCTVSIVWHATGLSGIHALTATVETKEGLSANSAPVMVSVLSPPPSVSITSPTNGATVKGTISIAASGATSPSQVDYPASITVYDGVKMVGSIECQGQQTCQGAVIWPATGLSGKHTLTALIQTHNGNSTTSAPDAVTVVSPPPHVKITSPDDGAALRPELTVSVQGDTDPSQDDYPDDIDIYDGINEIGSVDCQGQQTCSGSIKWSTDSLKGSQVLTAVIHTQNGLEARSAPITVGGTPHPPGTNRRSLPQAAPTCHIKKLAIRTGHSDPGTCTIQGAPAGTQVAIQYRNASRQWVTVVKGHLNHSGRFRFRLRGTRRATYALTILISASSSSAATRDPIGVLHVE
jgi:hypothetical protein